MVAMMLKPSWRRLGSPASTQTNDKITNRVLVKELNPSYNSLW